mmetsp:Transcript_27272/g.87387  ORF Transcript_27272/g.87387 Transcript_27272/m.87387 type:complete len:462 (-) Transcript_27272:278-1663(-)
MRQGGRGVPGAAQQRRIAHLPRGDTLAHETVHFLLIHVREYDDGTGALESSPQPPADLLPPGDAELAQQRHRAVVPAEDQSVAGLEHSGFAALEIGNLDGDAVGDEADKQAEEEEPEKAEEVGHHLGSPLGDGEGVCPGHGHDVAVCIVHAPLEGIGAVPLAPTHAVVRHRAHRDDHESPEDKDPEFCGGGGGEGALELVGHLLAPRGAVVLVRFSSNRLRDTLTLFHVNHLPDVAAPHVKSALPIDRLAPFAELIYDRLLGWGGRRCGGRCRCGRGGKLLFLLFGRDCPGPLRPRAEHVFNGSFPLRHCCGGGGGAGEAKGAEVGAGCYGHRHARDEASSRCLYKLLSLPGPRCLLHLRRGRGAVRLQGFETEDLGAGIRPSRTRGKHRRVRLPAPLPRRARACPGNGCGTEAEGGACEGHARVGAGQGRRPPCPGLRGNRPEAPAQAQSSYQNLLRRGL